MSIVWLFFFTNVEMFPSVIAAMEREEEVVQYTLSSSVAPSRWAHGLWASGGPEVFLILRSLGARAPSASVKERETQGKRPGRTRSEQRILLGKPEVARGGEIRLFLRNLSGVRRGDEGSGEGASMEVYIRKGYIYFSRSDVLNILFLDAIYYWVKKPAKNEVFFRYKMYDLNVKNSG